MGRKDVLYAWVEERCTPPLGRVLDAGTGRNSLPFLLSLPCESRTAVTADSELCATLAREFALGPGDRLVAGLLSSPGFLAGERFDVVLADYLIGAVELFEPYRQADVIRRLAALLAPGSRLFLIGWEPMQMTPARSPGGRLVLEMARTKDALRLLLGLPRYLEFPLAWTEARLGESGLRVVDRARYTNVFGLPFFEAYACSAEHAADRLCDARLARTFRDRVAAIVDEAGRSEEVANGVRFGFDYVLEARAPDGSS